MKAKLFPVENSEFIRLLSNFLDVTKVNEAFKLLNARHRPVPLDSTEFKVDDKALSFHL